MIHSMTDASDDRSKEPASIFALSDLLDALLRVALLNEVSPTFRQGAGRRVLPIAGTVVETPLEVATYMYKRAPLSKTP